MKITIIEQLMNVVKRGGEGTDVELALKASTIVALSIEANQKDVFTTIKNAVWEIVTRGDSTAIRAAAIQCVTMACFLHSSEPSDNLDSLEALSPVLDHSM